MALTLENGCFSLNFSKSTSHLSLFLSLNFCNKTSEPEPGILGFGRALVPGEKAEGQEEKAVGKTGQGIPFIARRKIC